MPNMVRFDPFSEMLSLREAMDSLFENAMIAPRGRSQESGAGWGLPLDVTENADNIMVKASIPGVKPEDLEVTVHGDMLTIKGEMKADEEKKDERYHLRERRWGSFARSISLPVPVKADSVEADYDNGVLTLTLPKTEEVKPKRITIKGQGNGSSQPRTVEGHVNQK